jgi:hypothetical protein
MRTSAFSIVVAIGIGSGIGGGIVACSKEEPYQPKPASTAPKANLPPVPTLPALQKKIGADYTVRGASHDLNSAVHGAAITAKAISIVGYIVKTNYADAPECAVHEAGKADPPDCKAPVPTFWIADDKGLDAAASARGAMQVMGWASNFARVYSMIQEIGKSPADKQATIEMMDDFWGVKVPAPLPAVGAKVRVTGNYGVTFTKASGGAAADPRMGILTYQSMEVLEPAAEAASLPGMKVAAK